MTTDDVNEYRRWVEAGSLIDLILGNGTPAPTDRGRAEDALRSANPIICSEGCFYLLAHSGGEPDGDVLAAIERLATAHHSIRGNLLLAFDALSSRAFRRHPELVQFLFTALDDPEIAVNAASIVGKLAAVRHPEALERFHRLKQSAPADVQRNAQLEFDKITAAFPASRADES